MEAGARAMRVLRLALRMLGREWRSGELGVLLLALTVAVAALTGVGFLVSRISAAVALQASEVLAADVRLGSPQPLDQQYFTEATRRGLHSASSTALLSVVFNGDASQLTNVAAVSERVSAARAGAGGRCRLRHGRACRRHPGARGGLARFAPARRPRGHGWDRTCRSVPPPCGSAGCSSPSPIRAASFAELAPSALMNVARSAGDAAHPAGSRVSYAGLFAGERDRIDDFKVWLRAHKRAGERLRDITDASPQLRNAIERSGRFLSSRQSRQRAAVRDRRGDGGAPLRAPAPRHRGVAEDPGRDARLHAGALGVAAADAGSGRSTGGRGARLPRPGVAAAHDPRAAHRDRAAAARASRPWGSAWSRPSRCWRALRCRRCCSWRACRRCGFCVATSGRRRRS